MIILTNTTDKIDVVLGGAITTNQLRCMTSWRDITTSAYTPGRTVINTNSTTDVDISGSPASSTQRVIDFISIHNTDTLSATVTVKFDANGTEYVLFKATIASGERIEYSDGNGFKVQTISGAVKTTRSQGVNPITSGLNVTVLGSDVVNNNATANTLADVTGLSVPVVSGNTYWFRFFIQYTADATTTGSRWALNFPGGTLRATSSSSLSTTAFTVFTGMSAADTGSAVSATSATTGANICIMEGFLECTSSGDLIARFASEISSSAITAKAGSLVFYQQVI